MLWLQRHAWWGLLALAASGMISGVIDLASGVTWQAWDVTGKTIDQIAAESSAGSRLSDFAVRTYGLASIVVGVLTVAVLLFGFRQDRLWAWWTMWMLVAWIFANSLLMRAFGAWGPATSSTIVLALVVGIMVVSATRFFKDPGRVKR